MEPVQQGPRVNIMGSRQPHARLIGRYAGICNAFGVLPHVGTVAALANVTYALTLGEQAVLDISFDGMGDLDGRALSAFLTASCPEVALIDICSCGTAAGMTGQVMLQVLRAAGSRLRVVNLMTNPIGKDALRDLFQNGLACRSLDLSWCRVRKLDFFGPFQSLQTLLLDHNPTLTSLPEGCFSCAPQLRKVSFCATSVTNLWTSVAALLLLPTLLELRFQCCSCCPASTAPCPFSGAAHEIIGRPSPNADKANSSADSRGSGPRERLGLGADASWLPDSRVSFPELHPRSSPLRFGAQSRGDSSFRETSGSAEGLNLGFRLERAMAEQRGSTGLRAVTAAMAAVLSDEGPNLQDTAGGESSEESDTAHTESTERNDDEDEEGDSGERADIHVNIDVDTEAIAVPSGQELVESDTLEDIEAFFLSVRSSLPVPSQHEQGQSQGAPLGNSPLQSSSSADASTEVLHPDVQRRMLGGNIAEVPEQEGGEPSSVFSVSLANGVLLNASPPYSQPGQVLSEGFHPTEPANAPNTWVMELAETGGIDRAPGNSTGNTSEGGVSDPPSLRALDLRLPQNRRGSTGGFAASETRSQGVPLRFGSPQTTYAGRRQGDEKQPFPLEHASPRHASPLCYEKHYRVFLLAMLPDLQALDNLAVSAEERTWACQLYSQIFEGVPNGRRRQENLFTVLQRRECGGLQHVMLRRRQLAQPRVLGGNFAAKPAAVVAALRDHQKISRTRLQAEAVDIDAERSGSLSLGGSQAHPAQSRNSAASSVMATALPTECSEVEEAGARNGGAAVPVQDDAPCGVFADGMVRSGESPAAYQRSLAASRVGSCAWPAVKSICTSKAPGLDFHRRYRPRQFEYSPLDPALMVFGTLHGEVVVVNHEADRVVGQVHSIGAPHSILGLCWLNCDPSKLIGGCDNGSIQLYDVNHMRASLIAVTRNSAASPRTAPRWAAPGPRFSSPLHHPAIHTYQDFEQLTSVHINCTDDVFLASGYSNHVGLYDLRTGRRLQIFPDLHQEHINVLKFAHHSPHVFATSSFDRAIKVWDTRQRIASRSPLYSAYSDSGNVMVCFSPDDHFLLASAVDNEVRQYLAADGRLHTRFELEATRSAHNYTRSYYMNGRDYIVTGSCEENAVRICCARTGRRLRDVALEGRGLKNSLYVQSLRGDPFKDFHFCVLVAYNHPNSRSEIVKVNLMAGSSSTKGVDWEQQSVPPAGMGA